MKHVLALVLTLVTLAVKAQQKHFVYIQSDNQQPFYVKLDKKIMSSTTAGYIIIPKLLAGPCNFTIGFPKNEWPEQKVTCQVTETDAGYILKNFGDKGWGLFNFQTMDLLMANNTSSQDTARQNQDAFASTLSNVVNDPGLKTSPVEPAEEKTEKTKPAAVNEKPAAEPVKKAAEKADKETVATKPVKEKKDDTKRKNEEAKAPAKPAIRRIKESQSADSASYVYVDNSKGTRDTIDVIIPSVPAAPAVEPAVTAATPVPGTIQPPAVDTVVNKPAASNAVSVVTDEPEAPNKVVITATPVTDTIAGLGARPAADSVQSTVLNQPVQVTPETTSSEPVAVEPVTSQEVKASTENTKPADEPVKEPRAKKSKAKKKKDEAPVEANAIEKSNPVTSTDTAITVSPVVTGIAAEQKTAQEEIKPLDKPETAKKETAGKKSRKKKEDRKQPDDNPSVQQSEIKQTTDTVLAAPVAVTIPVADTVSNTAAVNTQIIPEEKKEPPVPTVTVIPNPGPDSVAILKQAYDSLQRVMAHMADSLNEVVRIKAEQDSLKSLAVAELKQKALTDSLQRVKEQEALAAEKAKQKELDEKPAPLNKPVVTAGSATCKQYVDDDEYLNLRKKMDKNRDNENEILAMAHRVFEKRCFSTKQIQRLSLLFSSDSGKYKLFDDAYQYTYDKENFASLESELTDEYYKKRFRVMLR